MTKCPQITNTKLHTQATQHQTSPAHHPSHTCDGCENNPGATIHVHGEERQLKHKKIRKLVCEKLTE